MFRWWIAALLAASAIWAVQPGPPKPVEFVCPMDPEVRSKVPGTCPRCGMKLVAGIQDPIEYRLEFTAQPPTIPCGREVTLGFRALDPKTGRPASRFEIVHEKLFHLFLISQDLQFFAHVHPEFDGRSQFRYRIVLPKPGAYGMLADFYPAGGTPQLLVKTFSTAGYDRPLEADIPRLQPDLQPKHGENLSVELKLEPARPIAGKKTLLFFRLSPADGLERYIGAWAHMLAVSADLVDTIHEHPFVADGGPEMQFNVFFPREGMYRLWVQFQRKGVVNTVSFTVPVSQLR